jgi:hypothetical protein
VSLFVPSPEIENRDAVEGATGRSTKIPSPLNDIHYFIFKRITKKNRTRTHFFPAVALILQFSNFKATVIPTSLVILLVLT